MLACVESKTYSIKHVNIGDFYAIYSVTNYKKLHNTWHSRKIVNTANARLTLTLLQSAIHYH